MEWHLKVGLGVWHNPRFYAILGYCRYLFPLYSYSMNGYQFVLSSPEPYNGDGNLNMYNFLVPNVITHVKFVKQNDNLSV